MRTIPTCSPLGPTNRTSGTRIRSLMRGSTLMSTPSMSGSGSTARESPRACAAGANGHGVIRRRSPQLRARTEPDDLDGRCGWESASTCMISLRAGRSVCRRGYQWRPDTFQIVQLPRSSDAAVHLSTRVPRRDRGRSQAQAYRAEQAADNPVPGKVVEDCFKVLVRPIS